VGARARPEPDIKPDICNNYGKWCSPGIYIFPEVKRNDRRMPGPKIWWGASPALRKKTDRER